MQINIQGHKTELTQTLKDYVNKKIGKLKEFYNNIIKTEVILDIRDISDSHRSQVAEVSIWLSGKKVIRASEAASDMYAAIDLVYEELKKQVTKHKEKHSTENRRIAERIKEFFRRTSM